MTLMWTKEALPRWDADKQRLFGQPELAAGASATQCASARLPRSLSLPALVHPDRQTSHGGVLPGLNPGG